MDFAARPLTDAWSAAHDFDRVGEEVSKLSRLLEVLDEVAVTSAPSLNAPADTWARYVDRIAAVVAAMQVFSGEVEHLVTDCAAKLRTAPASRETGEARRHAA